MAATPYKGILFFVNEATGERFSIDFTADDVVGNPYIFPDGHSYLKLPDGLPTLVDVVYSSQGTDCKETEIFVNQKSYRDIIIHNLNTSTAVTRQLQLHPIPFKSGAMLVFKQKA